ncbi:MAG: alanyl-tRNA editing protein [Chloroflexota bacterium]|nr:alanyl-tRNA editing protein [Dehalococcoidia bacterium]MDE2899985.1 alanyl-tRNA editing protein [Chloroflexota bacterium]
MTDALYHHDSYIRTFEATVTEVREDGVVLDRTAFYPGGGGQPNDVGTLSAGGQTWQVVKVGRKDGAVVHQLEGGAPAVGDTVTGAIDWERRHNLMRTHTALHVLCGVIWRDYGAQVTGGDMQPLAARMDFEFEHMTATFAEEVEELVNKEVANARPISTRILPRDEAMAIPDLIRTKINLLPAGIQEVRVVEIEGLDLQADGGTHLSNTRDVGRIRIVGHESKGRINKRLRIAVED